MSENNEPTLREPILAENDKPEWNAPTARFHSIDVTRTGVGLGGDAFGCSS